MRKKYQQLPNFRRWVDVELGVKDLDSNSSNVREAAMRISRIELALPVLGGRLL